MSSTLVGVIAASLCFCSMSFAKPKTQGNEALTVALTKPMDIRRTVEFLKKFESADKVYHTMNVLVPSLGLARWIQYFKQNNVDLNKLSFNDLRVDGNQVFIPKVKVPFVFSNDQKISYKGVDFKIVKGETPEQIIDRMRRAWGSNSELGFELQKKTSLFSYFLNETHAADSLDITKKPFGDGLSLLIALIPFTDRVASLNRRTSGYLVDALKLKNPKLNCDSDGNFKSLISKNNEIVPLNELTVFYGTETNVKEALKAVCQKGPQQAIEWNRLFPLVLEKVSTGEVHIDKVDLGDPAFEKALPSK
ncbi:MAG: hypothetical protein IPK04_22295 [Bdellovibrionales bacterium]|nr:hypothetical protein [Bdellovibrionales bacterium]